MTNYWFHPEEEKTIAPLLEYFKTNRKSTVKIKYSSGEEYRCRFFSSYDADNESELDKGIETEPVDYFAVALDPIEIIVSGPHYSGKESLIELSYRDFPEYISSENGTIIYSQQH